MAKEETNKSERPVIDPVAFVHQPHDKYARFVLQIKEVALEMLQFCVPAHILENIDMESLEISETSFVDEDLKEYFSDICYEGKMQEDLPFRITFILEHKSAVPKYPIMAQLHKYVTNIWSNDIRQNNPLTLTIPIVIYHGERPLAKESPESLFKGAPKDLLGYVPHFDYVLLDLSQIATERLEQLEFLFLRNILLALKQSRNAAYVDVFWEKIIIFAPQVRQKSLDYELFKATVIYLNSSSNVFSQKLKQMENALSAAEQQEIKPFLLQMYEEWMEKGKMKGIEEGMQNGILTMLVAFIQKDPNMDNTAIANLFNISTEMVEKARKMLPKK
ncbi:MAG: Rpn family recombination-promoting nuclease/putative transposase [Saprospiraceae bacterium]|nr:Rpn family recombination-promoting nuclease/putative transposase [Saprospiraceae bacterium]